MEDVNEGEESALPKYHYQVFRGSNTAKSRNKNANQERYLSERYSLKLAMELHDKWPSKQVVVVKVVRGGDPKTVAEVLRGTANAAIVRCTKQFMHDLLDDRS